MGPMGSHRVPSWHTGPWCSSVQWLLATLLAPLPRLAPSPSATVPSDTSLKSGRGQWKHTNSLWRFGETLCNWLRSCELKQLSACVTTVWTWSLLFLRDLKLNLVPQRPWASDPGLPDPAAQAVPSAGYCLCIHLCGSIHAEHLPAHQWRHQRRGLQWTARGIYCACAST